MAETDRRLIPVRTQTAPALVEQIARDQPAPGCGAAAGVALSLGAACAAKAFIISARKRSDDPLLRTAASQAKAMADAALDLSQRDGEDFEALLRDDAAAAERALQTDARALLDLCGQLERLIGANRAGVEAAMEGDIEAAGALTEACRSIVRRNLSEL